VRRDDGGGPHEGIDVPRVVFDLQGSARLHEIDGQLDRLAFILGVMKWAGIPLVVVSVAVGAVAMLDGGASTLWRTVGAVGSLAVTAGVMVQSWRTIEAQVAELEFERRDLVLEPIIARHETEDA
jgi:ABC-type sulfate transport system permease component